MLRKNIKGLTALLTVLLLLMPVCAFAAVANVKPPVTAAETKEKWVLSLGTDYKNAPSIPALYGDYLYVMSGKKIYKINKSSGETVKTGDMSGRPTYAYIPVTVAQGKVFCPIGDGVIEAFDADTLTKLWSVADPLGGQAMTPIAFENGKIFTGFWNSDTDDANFDCIDASSGKILWSLKRKGGYYWSECAFYGNYAIIGGEDGVDAQNGDNYVYSVRISDGSVAGSLNIQGDMRSGITNVGNTLYMVTKAAKLYKTSIDSSGNFGTLYSTNLAGYSTSTPTLYGGKIYIGMAGGGKNEGYVGIFDASSLTSTAQVKVQGFPQSEILVASGYDSPVAYTTYNNGPGGVVAITQSGTSYSAEEIYTPSSGHTGYCISTVVADTDGSLYYKNDSGTIFALTSNNSQDNSGEGISGFINLLISYTYR